jgi:hypothetical protein
MLAVLVIVVPFCVTVMTDGTRLGPSVGKGLGVMGDVDRVVGVGVAPAVVDALSMVFDGA